MQGEGTLRVITTKVSALEALVAYLGAFTTTARTQQRRQGPSHAKEPGVDHSAARIATAYQHSSVVLHCRARCSHWV